MAGNSSHDGRYAPPAAHVADVQAPSTGPAEPATRTRRFWAAMLDLGIAVGASLLLRAVSPWDPFYAEENAGWWTFQPVSAGLSLLLFLAIHGVLLVRSGQTVGKAVLGLRIVRPDGGKPAAFQLLAVRYGLFYALMVVPFIGTVASLVDCLLIFRSSRRCLHDSLADTLVVKA